MKKYVAAVVVFVVGYVGYSYLPSTLILGDVCNCHQRCKCGRGGDKICYCGSITEDSPFGRRCHVRCQCSGEGKR